MTPRPESVTRPPDSGWSWAGAILLSAYYLITSIYIASKRLFWYDEVSTVLVSRLPSVTAIWKALLEGADLLPISYYVIVRASEGLFGRSELAARLPSALGFAFGLLIAFDCTRRLTNGLYGLIAPAILTCSFLSFYGYETRPYGLYFMFSTLLLWLWLHSGYESKAAWAFGAAVFTGTMVHYYLILCLVPYGVCEAIRRCRPSAKMLAGAIGGGLALALLAPQILLGYRVGSGSNWWANPSLGRLRYVFDEFFPTGLFLLALLTILAALASSRNNVVISPMSDGERLSWFFLLIPFAGYVLATAVTHGFYNRYFIGALPGIAVGFACLLYRHFGESRLMSAVILVLFAVFGMAQQASKVRNPELIQSFGDQQEDTKQLIAWEDTFQKEGKKYTAVSVGGLVWLEAWYYSKHPERYVAVLNPGVSAGAAGHYYPPMWTLDDLKQHAHETVVASPCIGSAQYTGHLQSMKDKGLKVTVRFACPLEIFYFE